MNRRRRQTRRRRIGDRLAWAPHEHNAAMKHLRGNRLIARFLHRIGTPLSPWQQVVAADLLASRSRARLR